MSRSSHSAFLAELARFVPAARLRTDPAERWTYGYDNSRRQALPDAVVFAETHEETCAIVRLCAAHRVPLVARGRGTATTGAAVPVAGGVVLAFERMTRILEVNPDDRTMTVEAGVTNGEVQRAAAACGLFWPPDPTSAGYSTVGGNIACNAGGPRTVKYGAARENVLGLRAVTGTGETLHTGGATTKRSTGYDLTRLIVGSEGTLAIVTAATLKLHPLPAATRTLRALYTGAAAAAQAVATVMRQPILPCMLEFMDAAALTLLRGQGVAALPPEAGALLLIEVDGSQDAVEHAAARLSEAATVPGLIGLDIARDAAEAEQLRAARKALSPALRRVAPDKINEDVVVPVSRLPELVARVEALGQAHEVRVVTFGHAGNGNLHVNILYDRTRDGEAERAERCLAAIFTEVFRLGGTLSGEHGIGLVKRDFMREALDPVELALMRAIKRQFDPYGILNPGKLLPEE
ncbi:MAG TPA: FAD-linked oxidase C-terminal domain-containing protein [Gammaproteobacteria bacterium]|nr:FAD-linked oxidase C-terminal domain-containing protein [Gammaproteobacteria bacterium]